MHKETVIDKIEVLDTGTLQVRRGEYFVDDTGDRTFLRWHRVSYPPGWDLSAEAEEVRQHAAIAWTPERRAAQRARAEALATRAQRPG